MEEAKFCANCGKKINKSANFCQYCGYQQTVSNETNRNAVNEAKVSHKNVSEQASIDQGSDRSITEMASKIDPTRFGNGLKLDNINAYRNRLGFNSTDNICVYGYFFRTAALIALGGLVGFASKYYIISFEHDGVLLLGLGITERFNGKNSFINFSDISSIKLSSFGSNYHLTVGSSKGEIKAKIVKMMLGRPWQAQNAKKLAKLYR